MEENMNNELNENNSHEPNNKQYQFKDNNIKVLLIIVIVLLLTLIGLTSYKMLVYDKKNNSKDNKEQEQINNNTENKSDETSTTEEVPITKEMEDKLKTQVQDIPLFNIVEHKHAYKDMYESYIINSVLSKLSSKTSLTDEELSKTIFTTMDNGRFVDITKTEGALYYIGSEVISKVKELYSYDLSLEKIEYGGCQVVGMNNMCKTINYDKNIDKFIVYNDGGTAGKTVSTVIDTKYSSNTYKIKFVVANFEPVNDSNCVTAVDKSNKEHKMCTDEEITNYNTTHKDELPQYEISFKIDGSTYKFVDIKKVN